jgi:hypothetical protein
MADDTNNELATLLAADMPVSPAERELAHRNRKLRQPVQPADHNTIVDPRLVGMLASGGIGSDARMPVRPVMRGPGMERQIQQRAMAGYDPTPEQDAYLRAVAPEKEARGERLASAGAELSGIPQIGRAASSIGDAASDPSLANITNAGAQTALAAFRPRTAMAAPFQAPPIGSSWGTSHRTRSCQTRSGTH